MKIRILITGGTIDKEYDQKTGEVVFVKSYVKEMLNQARHRVDTAMQELMLIDSLDMTDADRHNILETVKNAPEDRIVITHGTDTMVETAKLLGKEVKDKTIVLLGSMRPFKLGNSDALFNLGSAITAAQILEPGVYITMNGKIFPWNKVRKNKQKGEFEGA